MEHPLVRSIRNQSHRMPLLDHLDPVPTHDGSLRNASNNPIAFTYESNYTPASYECYYMTPSLKEMEFYSSYDRCQDDIIPISGYEAAKAWLDQRIEALKVHYEKGEAKKVLTESMYHHILTLEAFNIWLTLNGRWYIYRPPVHVAYKMSMPEYVFIIHKSDTESKRAKKRNEARSSKKQKKEEDDDKEQEDGEEEEEAEEEEEKSVKSLAFIIKMVFDQVDDVLLSEKRITNILRDRMRGILLNSRFSHITFTDTSHHLVKYDVHGLPKSMRIIEMKSALDCADALWCHCLFQPNEYIWKAGATNEYNLCVVAWYAWFQLLSELRRHCIKNKDDTENKKGKRKRSNSITTTTSEMEELRNREVFHNSRILHPSKLRYTYYARNGMVYATKVVATTNGYTLWDTFSLTTSFWTYIGDIENFKQVINAKYNVYYNEEHKIVPGKNLYLEAGGAVGGIVKVPHTNYYVKNEKEDYYEEVHLGDFLRSGGLSVELQDRIDALFMICDTFTEVFLNLRSGVTETGLPLRMVKESAMRVAKERMNTIESFAVGGGDTKKKKYKCLLNWLSSPNEHDLYLACKHFLSSHHERMLDEDTESLDGVIKDEVESLCRTLTVYPDRLKQYNSLAIDFDVGQSNKLTHCKSLSSYLSYCRIQLKKHILVPLAKAWYLYNPVVTVECQQQTTSSSSSDSTVAHLRQLIISEVCSSQFQLNLTQLINSKHQLKEESDIELLQCAYQVMKHEVPEKSNVLVLLSQALEHQKRQEKKDEFRERCKNRIECMMQQRGELDPVILLDICDKMAYKQGRVFGSIHEMKIMIEEILKANNEQYNNNNMHLSTVRKFSKTAIHHKDPFINGLADSLKHV